MPCCPIGRWYRAVPEAWPALDPGGVQSVDYMGHMALHALEAGYIATRQGRVLMGDLSLCHGCWKKAHSVGCPTKRVRGMADVDVNRVLSRGRRNDAKHGKGRHARDAT